MQQLANRHENHLSEIIHLLSLYQALHYKQLVQFYPDLPEAKIVSLIRRLEKSGRLIYQPDHELILHSKDTEPNPDTLSAIWVLLDFLPDVTYHTTSDFPVSLIFYTKSDGYEVICVQEKKELLINQVLSMPSENTLKRLVIVRHPKQMHHITFPNISAFCTVSEDGKIQYYKKQGADHT